MKKRLIYNTQYIDFYIQEHKITKKEFCERCAIKPDLLKKIYQQDNSLELDVWFIRLLFVLNISADTFLFMEDFELRKKKKST